MTKRFTALFLPLFLASGCAYRFSNLHARPPKGVKTLAVEAIYDSTQVPIPHDLIWRSLQQAVAASGHLRLASPSEADAILRVHIESASLIPSGAPGDATVLKEPKIQESGTNPPSYRSFESLTQARALYPNNTATLLITAEIWNLTTKKLVLQRSYAFANEFKAFRGEANISSKSNFVQYQEALNNSYSRIGGELARNIVSDLLVQ